MALACLSHWFPVAVVPENVLWAFVYFILLFIPYANVAAWITLAVSGNYLYYRYT